jgi:sugar transferase (PEP-CTERM/EpsH1 system associated)
MKILFVAPYVPSLLRVRPFNLIRELARAHEVTVLAVGATSDWPDVAALRTFCRSAELVPLMRGDSIISCAVAAARGRPLQSAVCQSPSLRRRLHDLLWWERFDVVHVEHLRAAQVVDEIPDNLPRVYDSVDCISLLLDRTRRSSHSPRQRLIAMLELARTRRYEGEILGRFDQVAVTSPDDAAALSELNPRAALTVIPNGVDLASFTPIEAPRDPATLVFSGKMSYHANATAVLHFVDKIFPIVRAAMPEARLRIIGSAPPPAIQELARDPAIAVTGHVADLRLAVAGATVAVCPVTVKVGIQNKVLEAMAMGVPVVCSREGTAGLLARPGRDYLVADGPTEFAHQVCLLLADAALRDEIGRAGRCYVEAHHRWTNAARQLVELYAEAIVLRRRQAS